MTFVVGTYTATYKPSGGAAADLGKTKEGFRLIETPHFEEILTDDGGDVPWDAVLRGMTIELELDYMEYAKVTPAIYVAEAQGFMLANVGKLATSVAGEVVLTVAAGTTAATLDSAKLWTFYKCLILTDVQTMLNNHVRSGPLRFRCFPDSGHSNKAYAYA